MAIKTIDLREITSRATSVYEAVLVIAKRARAITAERRASEALQETEYESTEAMEASEVEVIEEEKAIVLAMDDFFENKLDINYREAAVVEEAPVSDDAALMKKDDVKETAKAAE